jgi:hypothetical protein
MREMRGMREMREKTNDYTSFHVFRPHSSFSLRLCVIKKAVVHYLKIAVL